MPATKVPAAGERTGSDDEGERVEVRIGVVYSPKEIEIDLGDVNDANQVADDISTSLAEGKTMLWLTDRRGRRVGVPTDKLAYVEIGSDAAGRHVGFSAI